MGNDLPDYQSQVIGVGLEATSFRSGLDADKPASPAAGDIWLARDTYYLYVCNVAGAWEKVAKLYLLLAGGTMSGVIAMGSNKITGLAAPSADADAARKVDVDTVDARLDDVSQAQPTRVLGTIYQNTSGKIVVVAINVSLPDLTTTAGVGVIVLCDSVTPPVVEVGRFRADGVATGPDYTNGTITFVVPPSYYYKAYSSDFGTPTVISWTEWALH